MTGADAARRWALEQGLSPADAERIWDAVALHSTTGIAEAKSPEAAVVGWGAGTDVFGDRRGRLPEGVLRAVLDRHPRAGFEDRFRAALDEAIRRCPTAYGSTWLTDTVRERHGIALPGSEAAFATTPFAEQDR